MGPLAVAELEERLAGGDHPYLLDIRRRSDYEDEHIPGSVNIDVYDAIGWANFSQPHVFGRMPNDREIIVVCYRGRTAAVVARLLESMGYDAAALAGGWTEWSRPINDEPVTQ